MAKRSNLVEAIETTIIVIALACMIGILLVALWDFLP
jgi:hypothetical protein